MRLAIGKFGLTPRRLLSVLAILAVIGAFFYFRDQLDLKRLHDHAHDFNAAAVLLALTFLPLLGFPVSVLHAIAGAKFGLGLGMVYVALSIAVQICLSYGIVRLAPNFFARRFDWLRKKLPPTTHRSLTLFTLLLPGAPYFAQNYVLAVTQVPFRIFFGYALPINCARSSIGVIFGEWSGHMTPGRIAVIVVYNVTIMLFCGLAFRRLRAQLQNRPPEENGPTQPARYGHAAR